MHARRVAYAASAVCTVARVTARRRRAPRGRRIRRGSAHRGARRIAPHAAGGGTAAAPSAAYVKQSATRLAHCLV